jgi:D-alanine-D-alanine ligase
MREVIGVLRGGPSSEYDVSLLTGASMLGALNQEKYEPRDIFVDRQGAWHVHGVVVTPERALRGVDVALNAMHGEFGEDGQVQRILQMLGVPYTGSDAAALALAFNKQLTREAVARLGVKIAHGVVLDNQKITDFDRTAFNLFRSMPHPVMVKPVVGGSSVGVSLADSYHNLQTALERAFEVSPQALVEEYIKGREATVGVIDNFRGEKLYALMPVEVIPERVPGNFSREEKNHLMTIARLVHQGLGLEHYSRSDFIVSRRGIYFVEVNPLPGLAQESIMPKALQAVGAKLSDFLDHIISLAKKRV